MPYQTSGRAALCVSHTKRTSLFETTIFGQCAGTTTRGINAQQGKYSGGTDLYGVGHVSSFCVWTRPPYEHVIQIGSMGSSFFGVAPEVEFLTLVENTDGVEQ